jgi:FtsZ-interacting cell division protein ZipA|tara:strand:- start:1443 stop:2078 length:636 start_codon:yes stop_codon:yes gene_type:complete
MSKDTVKLFQRARAALQSEKDSLSKALANAQATAADAEKRLAEIEAALGGAGTAPAKRRGRKPKKAAGKRRGRPAKKTAAKRGRPAKKKAAAKRKTVKKKAAKKAPRKAVKKAAKKAPKKAVKKAAKKASKKASKKAAKKAPAKKVKNKLSLKQVALAVTKGKALDAKQILGAAKKAGHKFSGKNPLNSLRVMLYTNKKAFKNNKGKFTAA